MAHTISQRKRHAAIGQFSDAVLEVICPRCREVRRVRVLDLQEYVDGPGTRGHGAGANKLLSTALWSASVGGDHGQRQGRDDAR